MMKRLAFLALWALLTSTAHAQMTTADFVLLNSVARTATASSSDQTNTQYGLAHIIINVTAYTSGNWTPKIQGKDPVSGNYYDVCVGSAISSTGMTIIKVGPGLAPLANAACADFLPRVWRVSMVGASTPISTFSVAAYLFGS